jgi:hypothetical protein
MRMRKCLDTIYQNRIEREKVWTRYIKKDVNEKGSACTCTRYIKKDMNEKRSGHNILK